MDAQVRDGAVGLGLPGVGVGARAASMWETRIRSSLAVVAAAAAPAATLGITAAQAARVARVAQVARVQVYLAVPVVAAV